MMGVVHDYSGSYMPARGMLAVAMGIAVVLIGMLGPYVYPSGRHEVQLLQVTEPPQQDA
jgi:hypothetical protein